MLFRMCSRFRVDSIFLLEIHHIYYIKEKTGIWIVLLVLCIIVHKGNKKNNKLYTIVNK